MDNIMRLPFKVSTTTSNFMMGVTAAASAVVYLHRGQIDPGIAMPVTIGVLTGATPCARNYGAHKNRSIESNICPGCHFSGPANDL